VARLLIAGEETERESRDSRIDVGAGRGRGCAAGLERGGCHRSCRRRCRRRCLRREEVAIVEAEGERRQVPMLKGGADLDPRVRAREDVGVHCSRRVKRDRQPGPASGRSEGRGRRVRGSVRGRGGPLEADRGPLDLYNAGIMTATVLRTRD
jgi:hypothetical protein